jgi:hypothetical protein
MDENLTERWQNTGDMRWIHLVFGLILIVVFTQTGTFMRLDFPDKEAIPQELRLLMRSRHIYILFSSLIHLVLGIYFVMRPETGRRILQYSGSAILFVSSILLFWAFVIETYTLQHFSDISRFGIYSSLAGVGLHLLGGIGRR